MRSTALHMLYEFLVAESRYEVRGSEYRASLKELLEDMLCNQPKARGFDRSNVHNGVVRELDDLVNYVGFVDCIDALEFNLKVCPGVRQYVYPEIPNFSRLDPEFVQTWQSFFDTYELKGRPKIAGRSRRPKAERSPEGLTESSEVTSDGYCSNSSSTEDKDHIDAIITADDILCPRQSPELLASKGNLMANGTETILEANVEKEEKQNHGNKARTAKVDDDDKVPVLLDTPYTVYDGTVVFGLVTNQQLTQEWSCSRAYTTYASCMKRYMSEDDLAAAESCEITEGAIEKEDGETFDMEPDEERSGKYDPNAIFGNYYCPMPKGYKRKLRVKDADILKGEKYHSVCYNNFTPQAMEITSALRIGTDKIPRVHCVGTLAERRKRQPYYRRAKNKSWKSIVQHRLEGAISGIFTVKNTVSNQCSCCSGWSLNNGCSVVFCELCEDRLINEFHDCVLERLFKLRRHLTSDLYMEIGYKYIDAGAKRSHKGECGSTYVTIPALCEVGGTYPKASLHDGRYVPNSMNLPIGAVKELSSVVYTNAELRPYSECHSQILAHCRQRRRQCLQDYHQYLEALVQHFRMGTSHEKYDTVVSKFNQVFKQGLVLLPTDGKDDKVSYFDEVTSYVMYKLPLDHRLLRRSFYRRGAYAGKSEHAYTLALVDLADHDKRESLTFADSNYPKWHDMAYKHSNSKHGSDGTPTKPTGSKRVISLLKSPYYRELLKTTGVLRHTPRELQNRLCQTGRMEVGFPTSLEMHILAIPEEILDPSMYSKPGMAFLFSLPAVIQSLAVMAPFLKVAVASNEHKRRAKDGGGCKT